MGSFFRRLRATFLFICSTSSTWTTDVQNILGTPEPGQNQMKRPETRKHSKDPILVSPHFFRHNGTFFVFHQRAHLHFFFDILQQNGC